MSYFQITQLVFDGAEISQRKNYGGKTDTLHLKCNSAFRLPFAIKVPIGLELEKIAEGNFIAQFKYDVITKMEAPNGVNFTVCQLHIRKMRPSTPRDRGILPKHTVVIERVRENLLPLADEVKEDVGSLEWPSSEKKAAWVGYQKPQNMPTQDDLLIVASHTTDGDGWYIYKIYTKEDLFAT